MHASPLSGLRSAWLEFRNFKASGWLLLSICCIALIPVIYAGLFLLAFLDPYGSLVDVPAAVVNLDQGATIDDEERNIGQELCDSLFENNEDRKEGQATGFDWKVTSQEDADAGLRDATYYMELIIPEDFSQGIADADSDDPQQVELQAYFNPSTNLIAQTVGSSMVTKIKAELNSKIEKEYFDQIFVSIQEAADDLGEAVDGSKDLSKGLKKLQDGSDTLTDGIQTAQDGTDTLANGASQLESGSSTLTDGLNSALSGSKKLEKGAKSAQKGSKSLTKGLTSAVSGSNTITTNLGTLATGATSVSSGVQQVGAAIEQIAKQLDAATSSSSSDSSSDSAKLAAALQKVAADLQNSDVQSALSDAETVKAAAPTIGDDLYTDIANIASAAAQYQSDATASATKLQATQTAGAALQKDVAALQKGDASAAASLATDMAAYQTAMSEYQTAAKAEATSAAAYSKAAGVVTGYLSGVSNTSTYASAATAKQLSTLKDAIDQLDTAINKGTDSSQSLVSGAAAVASGASQLQTGSATLTSGLKTAKKGSKSLTSGLGTLAKGQTSLTEGISTAANGSKKITYNLGSVVSGADKLSSGLGDAVDGSQKITDNLGTAKDGADELHDGLADGVDEMNDSVGDKDAKATMMSEPVGANGDNETGESITEVKNYGTGFAPYFIGLGMWVGCLMITFLVRSVNNRLLMSRSSSTAAVVSSYIPMLLIAFVQIIILLLFIQFGLKLNVSWPLHYYLYGLLVAACFVAIIQFMRSAFGTAGMVIVVVLLMLQLCTAAGTFPIEAELPIFNWLNPYLPMTYVVQGFRMAMCGLSPDLMSHSAIVLGGFTVGFLFLSVLLAHHRRRANMNTLYPKIQMQH